MSQKYIYSACRHKAWRAGYKHAEPKQKCALANASKNIKLCTDFFVVFWRNSNLEENICLHVKQICNRKTEVTNTSFFFFFKGKCSNCFNWWIYMKMFHSVLSLILLYESSFKIRESLWVKVLHIHISFIYASFLVLKLVGRSWLVEKADTTSPKQTKSYHVPEDPYSLSSRNPEETNLRFIPFLFQLVDYL